jgi:hypothetical protein
MSVATAENKEEIDVKTHFSRMMASMLARFTVASTVYFIAICILFSVALVRLDLTENDLHGILINQEIILANQANSAKERAKLVKTISTHTTDFKTIIYALNGVNK